MKSILISIKPKWVAKILNGEKTIEIRKTCPAIFRGWGKNDSLKYGCGFDVYIYCTKDKEQLTSGYSSDIKGTKYFIYNDNEAIDYRGKVVAKFTLNKVEVIKVNLAMRFFTERANEKELLEKSCLNSDQLFWYLAPQELKVKCCGYAWHISNLEIFDKPKELSEFYKVGYLKECAVLESHFDDIEGCDGGINESYVDKCYEELDKEYQLTKAPQSWCYVEE